MLQRVFLQHPATVNETYGQHLVFALRFASTLFLAAGAALVHALVPCLCEKTASRLVERMYLRTKNRTEH